MKPRLILASASPRRRQLLEEAGYPFEVDPSGVEEQPPEPGYRRRHTRRTRLAKGRRGRGTSQDRADPGGRHGLCRRRRILNKPVDRADAERMIRLQEGRDTEVIYRTLPVPRGPSTNGSAPSKSALFASGRSAIGSAALISTRHAGRVSRAATASRIRTRSSPWSSGSFSNVVGLPMERLARCCRRYPGCSHVSRNTDRLCRNQPVSLLIDDRRYPRRSHRMGRL